MEVAYCFERLEIEERFGFVRQFAQCFDVYRSPRFAKYKVTELLLQRIMGIALGYEDFNDHENLRHDPLMAVLAGNSDPVLISGPALAGKSGLNRLELTPVGASQRSR